MARDFAGTGYLNIGRAQEIEITGDMSISLLHYGVTTTEQKILGCYNTGSPYTGYGLRIPSSGIMEYWSNGVFQWEAATSAASAGQWNHQGITISGTGANAGTFYLNGSTNGTWSHTAPGAYTGTDKSLGALAGGGDEFQDPMAHVAIWDVALTAAEMTCLSEFIDPESVRPQSLVAHWPIYGDRSPEPDLRGGNSGTVTGTANASAHPPMHFRKRSKIFLPTGAAPPVGRAQINPMKGPIYMRSPV